jgi:hypothetical protein
MGEAKLAAGSAPRYLSPVKQSFFKNQSYYIDNAMALLKMFTKI